MRAIRVIGVLWNVELSVCMQHRRAGLRYLAFPVGQFPANMPREVFERIGNRIRPLCNHTFPGQTQAAAIDGHHAWRWRKADYPAAIRHGFYHMPHSGRAGHLTHSDSPYWTDRKATEGGSGSGLGSPPAKQAVQPPQGRCITQPKFGPERSL